MMPAPVQVIVGIHLCCGGGSATFSMQTYKFVCFILILQYEIVPELRCRGCTGQTPWYQTVSQISFTVRRKHFPNFPV